ncbi:hypothetical protein B296_00040078 [Ensete ventricosum]|uniref:Integrase zinc-binding domain-containing protein n=1 Tax=Ensete ventricosum TaxID=4639 RepID=A0A426ZRE3_ENSVE|nr:hypothetical protein B296_00040078 [Ensete ventricosum]
MLIIENFTPEASEVGLRENLDMLEERRAKAHLRNLHYQRAVAQLYNQRIRPRPIGKGDLVLKRAEVSDPGHTQGKLAPRWEGPYRVHLDVGIFRTLGEGVPFDNNIRVLLPKSLERHLVSELIVDPPHLLEARLEPSGCLVGGHRLLTFGLQFGLEKHYCLSQREDVALQAYTCFAKVGLKPPANTPRTMDPRSKTD